VSRGVRLGIRCACSPSARSEFVADSPASLPRELSCSACGATRPLAADRLTPRGGLLGCLACGHSELYTRKSFPAAAGIAIVVVAAVLAPFTYYVSLLAAALLDLALYLAVPEVVVCYVCASEHRGFAREPRHPRFDREIDERLRYGPKAVMGRPMRAGGTAGAPDPEH